MTTTPVDSPCINLCSYDYDKDFCAGCGRTLEEISYWTYFTSREKEQILERAKQHNEKNSNAVSQYIKELLKHLDNDKSK